MIRILYGFVPQHFPVHVEYQFHAYVQISRKRHALILHFRCSILISRLRTDILERHSN